MMKSIWFSIQKCVDHTAGVPRVSLNQMVKEMRPYGPYSKIGNSRRSLDCTIQHNFDILTFVFPIISDLFPV